MLTKLGVPTTIAACVMLSACGALRGTPSGTCDAHHRGAALLTGSVLVYAVGTRSEPATTYYACRRPNGHREELGLDEPGGLYGSDATTGGFTAAGANVVAQSSRGMAALAICARYTDVRHCPPARYWITVIDTNAERRVAFPVYARLLVPALVPFPVTVVLSAKQVVAWLEASTVGATASSRSQLWATALDPRGRSSLAASASLIDAGSIDHSSVRFAGRTLYWIRDGIQHDRTL